MSTEDSRGLDELERAVELYLSWRAEEPQRPKEAFLAAHAELRELLEPMIEDEAAAESESVPVSVPDDRSEPGGPGVRHFGDFELLGELGRGGMGVVHRAWQVSLGREVALKLLPHAFAQDATAVSRFRREAQTAARLEHPGIVRILAFGTEEELPWIAMELVEGVPLDRLVARISEEGVPRSGAGLREFVEHELGPTRVGTGSRSAVTRWKSGFLESLVDLAVQLSDALAAIHAAGIVHRDVKPSNVLLRRDGSVVLTDFGLARDFDRPSVTRTGDFAGTPHYMSPEQAEGRVRELGPASDVFSLGATLYELFTGVRPFVGRRTQDVVDAIRRRDPADPSKGEARLPGDLAAILLRCLEKEPERRYADARALTAELEAFRSFRPVQARRPNAIVQCRRFLKRRPLESALGAVLLIAIGLGVYVQSTSGTLARGAALEQEERLRSQLEAAYVAYNGGELERAQEITTRVLAVDPVNPHACILDLYLLRGPGEMTRERLAGLSEGFENKELLLRLQHLSDLLAEPSDAMRKAYEALGPPRSALACFLQGALRYPRMGEDGAPEKWREAADWFEQAILRSPRAELIHYMMLGMAVSRSNEPERARRLALAMQQLWPDAAAAQLTIGLALSFVDAEASEKALRAALAQRPDFSIAWRCLALTLSASGKREEAVEAIDEALKLQDGAHEAWHIRSILLTKLGRFEEAVKSGKRAVELLGIPSAAYLVTLATAVERNGDQEEALRLVREAARVEPTNEAAHRGLAGILRVQKDWKALRAEQLRWIDVHPGGPWAHMELARFLLELPERSPEDLELARKAARHSIQLHRDSAELWIVAARVEAAFGNRRNAEMALRNAERTLSGDPKLREEQAGQIADLRQELEGV